MGLIGRIVGGSEGVAAFGQTESDGLREIMARLSQNWQEDI